MDDPVREWEKINKRYRKDNPIPRECYEDEGLSGTEWVLLGILGIILC